MRKTALVGLLMVFVASSAFAAAITDATQAAGKFKPTITVEDNYIFNRDIKKGEGTTKFDTEKTNQVYAKLGMGIIDGLNIYTKLGASNAGEIKHENTSNANLKIKTDYGFLWGFGSSYTKEIRDGWKIGMDAQFNWWSADVDKITFGGANATNVAGTVRNYEIQGTPYVTKKFEITPVYAVNPYVGAKISYFKTETSKQITYTSGVNRTDSWVYRGKNYIGLVVGSDLTINKCAALQIEGRFFDETAITVGGAYKF
ncbi:MAG: hypothetical protein WCG78_00545 [Candidatus Omnitrophota bacterium]